MQKAMQITVGCLLVLISYGSATFCPASGCAADSQDVVDETALLQTQQMVSKQTSSHEAQKVSIKSHSHTEEAQMDEVKKDGSPDCGCIAVPLAGETQIWDGGDQSTSVTVPFSYGSSCELGWCYVDPCKCKLPMTKTTQTKLNKKGKVLSAIEFVHMPAFYSYAACGKSGDAGDSPAYYCKKNEEHWDAPLLGKETCKCVGWYNRPGKTFLTVGGEVKEYPAFVGGECMLWDKNRHPACISGGEKPSWCLMKWCFVDPDDCTGVTPPQLFGSSSSYGPPSTYKGKPVYWSYATCGDVDPW